LRKAELACGKSLDKSALALRLFRESHRKCKRPLEKRQAREQIKLSHQKLKAAKKNGAVESVAPVSNDDRELVHFDYQEARSLAMEIAEKARAITSQISGKRLHGTTGLSIDELVSDWLEAARACYVTAQRLRNFSFSPCQFNADFAELEKADSKQAA
jgi:hypothetical protein